MPALLRVKQLEQRLGIKPTCIYGRIKKGLLPPPIKYGARTSVWPENEIEACTRAIIAGAPPDEMRQLVQGMVQQRAAA